MRDRQLVAKSLQRQTHPRATRRRRDRSRGRRRRQVWLEQLECRIVLSASNPLPLSDSGSTDGELELRGCVMVPTEPAFDVGTSIDYVESIEGDPAANGDESPSPFSLSSRWSTTATNGSGLAQGDETIVTWSIAPDDTPIPALGNISGESSDDSNLIEFLGNVHGVVTDDDNYMDELWFPLIQSVFDRWSELTGITYVYEPNDDGAAFAAFSFLAPGETGVRGDVRIGGHYIDGSSKVLAYNFYPNHGDMVIDTSSGAFSTSSSSLLKFRNVVAHEAGHGFGLRHSESGNSAFLMEPFVNLSFDGPQFDDLLGAHRHYGDANGSNDSSANAVGLGTVSTQTSLVVGGDADDMGVSPSQLDFVSIDDEQENDFYSFSLETPSEVQLTLTPVGPTYNVGPQGGSQVAFDATAQSDLSIELIDSNGSTSIATADVNGLGQIEVITRVLSTTGPYYVRVAGSTTDATQMYRLEISANEPPPPPTDVYLNDLVIDPAGGELPDNPNEYVELRGPAGQSLSGVHLVLLEGDDVSSQGQIESGSGKLIDLSAATIGSNGFLAIVDQAGSPYPVAAGAAVFDVPGLDLENASYTAMLIHVDTIVGSAPVGGQDLDTDNDGLDPLPNGWTLLDSVAVLDGDANDRGYADLVFSANGIGQLEPGAALVDTGFASDTIHQVMRIGDSTGSTPSDWVAIRHAEDPQPLPPALLIQDTSDAAYQVGTVITDHLGQSNPTETGILTVALADASIAESAGQAATTITITRSTSTAQALLVTLASSDPGEAAIQPTATIPIGESAVVVEIDAVDDQVLDGPQLVSITASAVGHSPDQATIEVADDDVATVGIAVTTDANEAAGGNGTFTLTQSATTSEDTVVTYTVGGTATSGSDFVSLSGTVTIPAEQNSATIDVSVLADPIVEGTETIQVTLTGISSGASGVALDPTAADASMNLVDDDVASFTIAPTSISEGGVMFFSVFLNNQVAAPFVLDIDFLDGSASGGIDYVNSPGSLSFSGNPGQMQMLGVQTINDNEFEGDESFIVSLNSASPLITDTFTAIGTIQDNDPDPPSVESIVLGSGQTQSSVVRSITITFDSTVFIQPGAFVVTRTLDGAEVTVTTEESVVAGKTQVVLTFSGPLVDATGSLVDGNFTLTIFDTQIRDGIGTMLDGDLDNVPGGSAIDEFFRLFGDVDGDRDVDLVDFAALRESYGAITGEEEFNPAFDADDNGVIDLSDFAAFRDGFGHSQPPPA